MSSREEKIIANLVFGGFSLDLRGSEEGVFWKWGLLRKFHLPEILENRQTLENKGESDHVLQILETSEIFQVSI